MRLLFVLLIGMIGFTGNAEDIFVGGLLAEDQTWTKDNTYIVYNDLRIPEDVTLTIRAGVTVKIDQGRGIFVLGGSMLVDGLEIENNIDTVKFMANHTSRQDGWKWKGISFIDTDAADTNSIAYAKIVDAEIAIDITNCEEIVLENSYIENNQNLGVRLFNSKNCRFINSLFQNNYDGIEMVATNNTESSGNLVSGCVLKNINHNVYLLKAYGGSFFNNRVEYSLIEGGNNGVWMDNGGGPSYGQNTISNNVFVMNGSEAGYGLLLAQDSVNVSNNIFWKNHIAIFYDQFTIGSKISNNSIYQNNYGIRLSEGSHSNHYTHNTLTVNDQSFVEFNETGGTLFDHNNMIAGTNQEKVVINLAADDLNISNNFWNTVHESRIQDLIWDKNDDASLGSLFYTPYFSEADTTNPISPPLSVIRQLVDGQVKLSWVTNPEKDLRTYSFYYGDFENYTFSASVETGIDTVYFTTAIDIDDSVAITAVDNTTDPVLAQVTGHESPFAFAVLYPYAGMDDEICTDEPGYQTNGMTIPFDYETIEWSTGGDGNFNNPGIIDPVYFPGDADIENGQAVLTMGVQKTNDTFLYDSLILTIFNDPVVFAGSDTLIFSDAQLELIEATAEYQESIKWLSSGDGFFNNDALLNTTYTPGSEDKSIGFVELILTGGSQCGTATDTLKLFIEPFYSIEGKLWYEDQPVSDAVILAVKETDEVSRTTDIAQVDIDGQFAFERLFNGKYCLYAIPDTALKNGSVPAYYVNKLRWQDAHYFDVNADIFDVDISLPALDYTLPEGVGSISGYFAMPEKRLFKEEIFCSSFFDDESTMDYCNGGLSNITVFLYNSTRTKLLDYTITDLNGNFYFNKLPYGDYVVDAEKAGYQTLTSSVITLSAENQHEKGIVIELSGKKIAIHRTGSTQTKSLLAVYPNPVGQTLHIPKPETTGDLVNIAIYNTYGQLVTKTDIALAGNPLHAHFKLDVIGLTAGVYFGRINSQGKTSDFIFIRK